ncbi:MAG: bifunctional diaminohydroxyphosphoribosylaminopyrimidine deaminase/5-amino-6-(5-phosphoribosylamino)uracil reductase RibD [Alphaproteobacteria bacterium]|nr:bifunctional diaminohydroxyphosphoribosylaminopyrimidine deaminase/5-amino-6-(5-phosphoribosylamino)uracil reductase RibD [Alphaproteobacteria bacterium]
MRHALALAGRGLGQVAPNPAVGCIIVSAGGDVVGRGWTGAGGRPHAETQALAQAGVRARGATAYVTLEPCAHMGQTPPCADALIRAGIARVVAALEDPDPRVKGAGFARLAEAKIEVKSDILAQDAARLNEGFFLRVGAGRPLVTLKVAHSIDGRSAAASGESQWITSDAARRYGHLMRARNDAILVGVETVLADDPLLTCRLTGLEGRSPLRVVLDSRLRLGVGTRLAQTARAVPTLIFTTSPADAAPLNDCGVEVLRVDGDARGRPDIDAVLHALADRGVTRLLVEGGAGVQASFINRGRADRLAIFTAPMLLGAAGRSSVGALAALGLDEAPRFVREGVRVFGPDMLESYSARA